MPRDVRGRPVRSQATAAVRAAAAEKPAPKADDPVAGKATAAKLPEKAGASYGRKRH